MFLQKIMDAFRSKKPEEGQAVENLEEVPEAVFPSEVVSAEPFTENGDLRKN